MKRNNWYPAQERMGGFRCIKNRVTGELCLAGNLGEIWINSNKPEKMYACFTAGGFQARRMASMLGIDPKKAATREDSETKFTFSEELLPAAAKLLQIPKTRPLQCRYAENRGK